MGIIPLEYLPGETADSLGLTGRERYTVVIPEQLTPRMIIDIKVHIFLYIIFAALHLLKEKVLSWGFIHLLFTLLFAIIRREV